MTPEEFFAKKQALGDWFSRQAVRFFLLTFLIYLGVLVYLQPLACLIGIAICVVGWGGMLLAIDISIILVENEFDTITPLGRVVRFLFRIK